jgi:hypothetical protein
MSNDNKNGKCPIPKITFTKTNERREIKAGDSIDFIVGFNWFFWNVHNKYLIDFYQAVDVPRKNFRLHIETSMRTHFSYELPEFFHDMMQQCSNSSF